MNHDEVQLIGVFDPQGRDEGFTYTVNLPTGHNLWIGALCDDGSRMGQFYMAWILNNLIDLDRWNEGDAFQSVTEKEVTLVATVGELVDRNEVQAFQALTDKVRRVTVAVRP